MFGRSKVLTCPSLRLSRRWKHLQSVFENVATHVHHGAISNESKFYNKVTWKSFGLPRFVVRFLDSSRTVFIGRYHLFSPDDAVQNGTDFSTFVLRQHSRLVTR